MNVVYYFIITVIAFVNCGCKPSDTNLQSDLTLNVVDLRMIDEATGASPTKGGITFARHTLSKIGPILTELPINSQDQDRYHVRISWVQTDKVEHTFYISVEGYEPIITDKSLVETISESKSITGRHQHTIKLKPILNK